MQFVPFFFFVASFLPKHEVLNKTVTLHVTNVEFDIVSKEIERQTGYLIDYNTKILAIIGKVTVQATNQKVSDVLDQCLYSKPVTYKIEGSRIIIKQEKKSAAVAKSNPKYVAVKIVNKYGDVLPRVDITQKENPKIIYKEVASDQSHLLEKNTRITISAPGYISVDTILNSEILSVLQLEAAPLKSLDEILIIGYGTTTRRLATGNVTRIYGTELQNRTVNNFLTALEGRIPGLLITQINGLPGSYIKTQLNGQASIGTKKGRLPLSDPLFIVDGVPYAANNNSLQVLKSGSAWGAYGKSPLIAIDPNDIETIEVLKDADATAIYGSRGAKGVILITTKQGSPGKVKFTAGISYGVSTVTRSPDMLNTEQYIAMRRQALKNDSLVPTTSNSKDLLDTTRYVNFKRELLHRLAKSKDAVFSFSGGTKIFQYYFGANYHDASTIFPGDLGDKLGNIHFRVNYKSANQKFFSSLSANYSNDINTLITTDLSYAQSLPPNSPMLVNSGNTINWGTKENPFNNPLGYVYQTYRSKTENGLFSLLTTYKISNNCSFKATFGYNKNWTSEMSIKPIISLNSYSTSDSSGTAYFGINEYKSIIAEQEFEYFTYIGLGKLTVQVGNSIQTITNDNSTFTAAGYPTDDNYSDTTAATVTFDKPRNNKYNYNGILERLSYNWQNTYIANFTARHEISSKFGPIQRKGDYGAIGMAWIFSNERFWKGLRKVVSFGKFRGSYGITGNDPTGDYQYFDSRTNLDNTSPKIKSEVTKKLNCAFELGFIKDRLNITVNYYNNISNNLVVSSSTRSDNVIYNSPAKVQNTGLEFALHYKNNSDKKIIWSSELLLTIPCNKLLSFPNLDSSIYALIFKEGKSLTLQQGLLSLGVDPATGTYRFKDKDGDGKVRFPEDYEELCNLDPKAYGGIKCDFSYKYLHLGFFIEGRIQTGFSLYNAIYGTAPPGTPGVNQPLQVLNRWQQPGDNALFQLYTTGTNAKALEASQNIMQSDARFTDASFMRAKSIYLTFDLSSKWLKRLLVKNAYIFFQTNNAFTITNLKVLDPETQSLRTMPPLKTYTCGIRIGF